MKEGFRGRCKEVTDGMKWNEVKKKKVWRKEGGRHGRGERKNAKVKKGKHEDLVLMKGKKEE